MMLTQGEIAVMRRARIFGQLIGLGSFEMLPEAPSTFFLRIVDATITFETGPDGKVVGFVFHLSGRDTAGRRLP